MKPKEHLDAIELRKSYPRQPCVSILSLDEFQNAPIQISDDASCPSSPVWPIKLRYGYGFGFLGDNPPLLLWDSTASWCRIDQVTESNHSWVPGGTDLT
jgi:hypothetical protein